MKYLILSILMLGCLSACKPKTEVSQQADETAKRQLPSDLQNYENEIMKIHDEVMPRMNEIHTLNSQLRDIKSNAGDKTVEGLDQTLQSLENADKAMMDWMKNYSDTRERIGEEHLRTFYERELEKVTFMKNFILNTIDAAKAWLAAHPAG